MTKYKQQRISNKNAARPEEEVVLSDRFQNVN